MGKINLKDIQSRIASVEYTTKSVNNAMRNIVIPDGYISKNKVNLNDIQHRLAKRKAIDPIPNNLGVDLVSFDTELEINLMVSLIRIRYIRANSRGKVYDLTDERLFLRLNRLEQIKVVVSLLELGDDVVIDGYTEIASDVNIDSLKKIITKLELDNVEKEKVVRSNMEIFTRR
jgi:hypothetical protein